ncbi:MULTISPECIES: DUF2339 domain-containing protein [unclassified Janthinobacterium]|uniref:DUF2339 domain-containing protein n=1 Tax=unclassified Janthinobacterium TaxID=2610881 RepID=UPI0017E2FE26|nr:MULTISPECIES: DUF2339 domain-containing protein [unclassified Janthinobacterium]MBB5367219.1 putative membrane protein [Janthinobacterium sp. K2C7]MBB5380303.1 putative membrane protein [Janthinobacterium sp. K2Li3]MBB5385601.1 putative membrane protein [Janthinobacterium sp. K2E3]
MANLILIAVLLAGALSTAFIVSILAYMNTITLEEANRQLRKEINSVQQRLQALERSPATTIEAPEVALAKAAPAAAPIQPAVMVKTETVKAVPAPPAPKPAPTLPDTPAWVVQTDALLANAKTWLLTGNLVAKLGLLILFLGVSFLLKYVSAQVTLPIELRLTGIALFDIALLAWAWRIRISRSGISLPLQGTTLAILMLIAFSAFRLYELMPASLAFALLFVLTALTCLLAVLQNAVWLAVFGIVGGFAVPLLVSSGSGNHIGLFSYYALLNAGVLAIALQRAWRVLNVLSFGFTFAVATSWGLLRYTPDNYLSAQLFLILYVVFYIGIAIAYCARQAPRLKHYVDGTLVFGTPLAAMGLQFGLVQQFSFGLAFSALIAGLFYTGLAVTLWRRDNFRLLAEAFLALGIVFGTLAIPFALDGRWTSAAWALEGAGIVWVGLRQRQTLAWAFGLLVQLAAWISFLVAMMGLDAAATLQAHLWLGCLLLSAAAMVMALSFRRHGSPLHPDLMPNLAVMFLLAATAWLLGGIWNEILRRTDAATQLNLLTLSGLGVAALLAWLAQRLQWQAARALLLAVQVLAGLMLLSRASWAWDQHPASLFDGSFLSALLLGAAAFASAWFTQRQARQGDDVAALATRPLLQWSAILWFAAILVPLTSWLLQLIDGKLPLQAQSGEHWLALYVIAVAITTPAFALLAQRLAWPALRWLAIAAWLVLGLWSINLLLELSMRSYLPTGLSWLALACVLAAGEYLLLTWQRAGWHLDLRTLRLLHTIRMAAPWLMLWPVGYLYVSAWLAPHEGSVSNAWARYLPAWAMMLALAWLIRRCRLGGWPVAPIAGWYQRTLIPLAAIWSLLLIATWNIFDDGAMAPLPYLPLLNPLDLSSGFAMLLALATYRLLPARWQPRLPLVAACFVYGWFNLMLLRTVSHYLGVPYEFNAMLGSQFVQAMLSLVWSITALLLMRHAAHRQRRQQWSLGAVLLALVVVKLFTFDLSNVGGIERIVSFVGVGLLMLLIGYLAPFPKANTHVPAEPDLGAA